MQWPMLNNNIAFKFDIQLAEQRLRERKAPPSPLHPDDHFWRHGTWYRSASLWLANELNQNKDLMDLYLGLTDDDISWFCNRDGFEINNDQDAPRARLYYWVAQNVKRCGDNFGDNCYSQFCGTRFYYLLSNDMRYLERKSREIIARQSQMVGI